MGEQPALTAPVKGVVQGYRQGEHGPYAWATASDGSVEGYVTFSLLTPVWNESDFPSNGTIVILDDIRKKSRGWYAMSARYMRPSDDKA